MLKIIFLQYKGFYPFKFAFLHIFYQVREFGISLDGIAGGVRNILLWYNCCKHALDDSY